MITLRRLIATTGLLLFSACSPIYYAPNTHNVPLLQEKGEGMVSLSAPTGSGDGAELHGAYAISPNTGLMLNIASFNVQDDNSGNGGKGGLVELGVGYYRSLLERVVFETYGLLGGGDVENHFPSTVGGNPSTTGKIESKFTRYGFQSALGFKLDKVDIAFSARITHLNYSDISGSLVFSGEDQVQYLTERRNHWLAEPALTIRLGNEPLKLQIQMVRSYNLTDSDFRQDEKETSLGLVYHFKR